MSLVCLAAWAQPQAAMMHPPLETAFLVELADRMFARGEYAEAQNLIARLEKVEPQNPAVQQLSAKLKGRADRVQEGINQTPAPAGTLLPSTPVVPPVPAVSARDIASDIELIQNNIQRHERRNRDLEFLVRNLVQENDILARTLAKRNRDYLTLLKKVYGEGAELPELNITTDVERTQAIMNSYQDQLVDRDRQLIASNQELSRIDREIAQINNSLKAAPESTVREQTAPAPSLSTVPFRQVTSQTASSSSMPVAAVPADVSRDVALKEKRDHLVDKSIEVLDKARELRSMQNDMAKFSDSLQEADAKYAAAVKEYDEKLKDIKSEWAQDKTRQQDEINKLKEQLSTKSAELDAMQGKIAAQTPALNEHKKDLALKDESIAKVDASILEKDKEIIALKDVIKDKDKAIAQHKKLIVEKEETIEAKGKELAEIKGFVTVKDGQIAEQKTKIVEQDETLQFVDEKTRDLQKRVYKIRQSLADGDRALDALKALVARLKSRAGSMPSSSQDNEFKAELDQLKEQIDAMMQSLHDKEEMIARLRARAQSAPVEQTDNPALRNQLTESKSQLGNARRSLEDKELAFDKLQSQIMEYERAFSEQEEEIAGYKTTIAELEEKLQDVDTHADQMAGLQAKIDEYQGRFDSQNETLTRQKEMMQELEAKLREAVDAEAGARQELTASRQKMQMLLENAKTFKANATTASERAAGLSEKVYNMEDQVQQQFTETNQELRFLKDTLAQRDKEMVALKKDALSKDEQLKYFYRKMNDATKALNANTMNRDQSPTAPSWSLESGENGVDFNAPWDPKNNDPYALQQRLSTAAKELDEARTKMTSQDVRMKELESKISAKEEELRLQKEDYNKLLTVDRTVEETKKARSSTDSARMADLEAKLAATQKELIEASNNFEAYKRSTPAVQKKPADAKAQALSLELEKKNKELENYKAEIKEKDEEIRLQREAIEHEARRFETLKTRLDEANKLVKVSENRFGGRDLSIQDLQNRIDNAKIRERDYKTQLGNMSSQLRESYRMVKLGELRLNGLKEQLAVKENRITALQKEAERLKKLLRERNDAIDSKLLPTDNL